MKNLIRISFAAAALFALLGAQVAGAQTKTVALSVELPAGDRDTDATGMDVQEGDIIRIILTPSGLVSGDGGNTGCLSFTGEATAGTDFAYTGSSAQRPSGAATCTNAQFGVNFGDNTARTREFRITDDNIAEGAETLTLTVPQVLISNGDPHPGIGVAASPNNAITVNILASDAATASIARAGSGVVAEGQSVEFTVSLSNPSQAQVTVSYTVANAAPPALTTSPAATAPAPWFSPSAKPANPSP